NRESVFVINNIELYALDRNTGRQQWMFELPEGAASAPVADDDQIYLSLSNGRFTAYTLPNLALWAQLAKQGKAPGAATTLEGRRVRRGTDIPAIGPLSGTREAYRVPPTGPQPEERYAYVLDEKLEMAPLQAPDRLLLPCVGGEIVGVAKAAAAAAWKP